MAKITETFLPNFITQLNLFKNTDAPAKYSKVKENYVKSFASEIKSYQLFDDYLKTNNSTANKLSNEYLTAALNYETIARNAFTQANSINTIKSNENNNVEWTKFSSNGIYFEYPSNWKVVYPQINRIGVVNSSNPSNFFFINLPIQNNVDPSINIVDKANSLYSKYPNATIIEPFTETFIAGTNAAIGKLRYSFSGGEIISNMVIINNEDKLYVFQYGNSPEQFDGYNNQQTMNHIFTSLSFNSNGNAISNSDKEQTQSE